MDDLSKMVDEAIKDAGYWKKQAWILRQGLKNVMVQIQAGTPDAAIYQAAKDCLEQVYSQEY